jgi:hypothetical protein
MLCKGVMVAVKDDTGTIVALITLATAIVFVVLIVTSIVFGVVGLSGISRSGSQGILARSLWGIGLSLILLGIFGISFYHGWVSSRSVHDKVVQVQSDMKEDVDSGRGISLDKQQARLNDLRATVDSAAQNASGNEALFDRAASACLGQLQGLMKNYGEAATALRNPPVLDMDGVTQRSQLQVRKELVKKFIGESEKMKAFFVNGEQIYSNELVRLSLPPLAREQGLKGFRRSNADKNELIVTIRDDDRRMGNAMLAMLDLLDENWGKWNYNEDRKKVDFDDPAVLDKYIIYRDELNAAAREQVKFQARLAGAGN